MHRVHLILSRILSKDGGKLTIGRDAIVSYWHYCDERDCTDLTFQEFLIKKPDGSWNKHVREWQNAPMDKLIIRYEDLLNDTFTNMNLILNFLNIQCTNNIINESIERSTFDVLKKLETYSKNFSPQHYEQMQMFRKGEVDSWRKYLSHADIEKFYVQHGGSIPELGYNW